MVDSLSDIDGEDQESNNIFSLGTQNHKNVANRERSRSGGQNIAQSKTRRVVNRAKSDIDGEDQEYNNILSRGTQNRKHNVASGERSQAGGQNVARNKTRRVVNQARSVSTDDNWSSDDSSADRSTGRAIDRQLTHGRRKARQQATPKGFSSKRSDDSDVGSSPLLRIPTTETDSEVEDSDVQNTDLNNAAKAHLNVLSGGQPQVHAPIFAKPISAPISSQINSKLKCKIWANRYIDFALILPSYNIQPKQQKFTLQLSNDSTFNLVPQTQTRKITHIAQWTSAFLRFVAVYSEKFPHEAPQLMKYGEIIRDLAYRRPGLAWYNYDMQFRHLRESVQYRWDMIYYDLWVPSATYTFQGSNRFQSFGRERQQPSQNLQRRNSTFLRNCCWAFNRTGRCNRAECSFPHTCGFCRGPHSAKHCNQSQSTGPDTQGQQAGNAASSGTRTAQQDSSRARPMRR